MAIFVLITIIFVVWYIWYFPKKSSPSRNQIPPSQSKSSQSISPVTKAKPHKQYNYSSSREVYDENDIYERNLLRDGEPDEQKLIEWQQQRDEERECWEETYTYDPD
ncbi:MAG: hypothetical protein ACYTXE_25490 [Nostoc sp.]